jgi:hypothetical protein
MSGFTPAEILALEWSKKQRDTLKESRVSLNRNQRCFSRDLNENQNRYRGNRSRSRDSRDKPHKQKTLRSFESSSYGKRFKFKS